MSSPLLARDDGDGAHVVASGVLVAGAVDRLLHRAGRVVGTEQDAVLLGGGVGAVGEGLVGVVLIVAAPLDPLAGVEHRRGAELLGVALVETPAAGEGVSQRTVRVAAVRVET